MRPISSQVLKCSATLKHPTGVDAYGKKTFATTALSRVYVEAPKKNALTALGEDKSDTLVLYFDCRRSTPAGILFPKGDVIEYKGQDYTIRESVLLPNPDIPHHWEVRLI